MLITRKKKVPYTWVMYSQFTLILTLYGSILVNTPFLLLIKKFIDNPAAIMALISIEVYVTLLGGPLVSWISDRIWTRYGRRKMFVLSSDFIRGFTLLLMPFAPNVIVLIVLRWTFGLFGDLGAPAQALIWEIVPPKQRGRSAGFFSAFMNIGNLIFLTLLIGRFHDVYFMGPFEFLTEMSGGTLLFIVGALLFLGIFLFECLGVKETYPMGRSRMNDGRKVGEYTLHYFFRSFFSGIFSKDLLPLYLLLIAQVMFGFNLGIFGPLMFTEEWGFTLQDYGNNIAIGVPLAVVISLIGGWAADKFGKMQIYIFATFSTMIINIIYVMFVQSLPDQTPAFWQIVMFGNIGLIFGGMKGVVAGPLMWEYVARNRMGDATSGIIIFNTLFRNGAALLIGVWLALWSSWFLPQSGYSLTTTYSTALSQEQIVEYLEAGDMNMEEIAIQPIFAPEVKAEVSQQWEVYFEEDYVEDLIKENEKLKAQRGSLEGRKDMLEVDFFRWLINLPLIRSQFLSNVEDIDEELERVNNRIDEIDAQLDQEAKAFRSILKPVIAEVSYAAGDQVKNVRFEQGQLVMDIHTLQLLGGKYKEPSGIGGWFTNLFTDSPEEDFEEERAEQIEEFRKNLRGAENLLEWETNEQSIQLLQPQLSVEPVTFDDEGYGIRYSSTIDPRFFSLFAGAYENGISGAQAYNLASAIHAILNESYGREAQNYSVASFSAEQLESDPTAESDDPLLQFSFTVTVNHHVKNELPADEIASSLELSDDMVQEAACTISSSGDLEVTLTLKQWSEEQLKANSQYDEAKDQITEQLEGDAAKAAFATTILRKIAETAAAEPIYVTVPEQRISYDHNERKYEYFLPAYLMMIATDVFGVGVILMIILLERRGVLHKYGAMEDDNR